MKQRLSELQLERGRLLERITTQRYFLARAVIPVESALTRVDGVVGRIQYVSGKIRQHPGWVAAAAGGLLFLLKKERSLRWARRAFVVWRTARSLATRLALLGLRLR